MIKKEKMTKRKAGDSVIGHVLDNRGIQILGRRERSTYEQLI